MMQKQGLWWNVLPCAKTHNQEQKSLITLFYWVHSVIIKIPIPNITGVASLVKPPKRDDSANHVYITYYK